MVLRIAFKEWAAVCQALMAGRQSIILRKGGIAEEAGEFRPEFPRFWLYPTYIHQQDTGLKPTETHWLTLARHNAPAAAKIVLRAWCEVGPIEYCDRLDRLQSLADWHIWSETTVMQRFQYRRPGLYILPVRVYLCSQPIELIERPEYAGCKTWVEFEAESAREFSEQPATPVLTTPAYHALLQALQERQDG